MFRPPARGSSTTARAFVVMPMVGLVLFSSTATVWAVTVTFSPTPATFSSASIVTSLEDLNATSLFSTVENPASSMRTV